ncbi:DUF4405 domain-containing protein [Thiorhodococcus minor]|uniref:DUF4405 domain-containing protein n=1 Tax=Thiorhodococcus minor TaxID=57489 RepID=A0A6M0JW49_9GAMM|nr:DUF4405 domain-containing protein [Thiorhodococcus minor]NEV61419.1 DUF4405 domain-containing protein [Thiorhodococcus minor]
MTKRNTRQWSTPAVIAAGTFMAVSGLLLFFGVHGPVKLAHEWIGLAFVVFVGVHVATHWPVVKRYFSQPAALAIIGGIAIAAFGLMLLAPPQDGEQDHDRRHGDRHAVRWDSGLGATIAALNPSSAQADAIQAILDEEASRAADSRYLAYQQLLGILNTAQRTRLAAVIQQRFDRQLNEAASASNLTADQKSQLGVLCDARRRALRAQRLPVDRALTGGRRRAINFPLGGHACDRAPMS